MDRVKARCSPVILASDDPKLGTRKSQTFRDRCAPKCPLQRRPCIFHKQSTLGHSTRQRSTSSVAHIIKSFLYPAFDRQYLEIVDGKTASSPRPVFECFDECAWFLFRLYLHPMVGKKAMSYHKFKYSRREMPRLLCATVTFV